VLYQAQSGSTYGGAVVREARDVTGEPGQDCDCGGG
jgi:hypothetical protein